MKSLFLATTILAALGATPAFATCSGNITVGNIVWISGCSSDNQANDGDDIKMFVDKTRTTTQTIDGSLGSNDQAFDNIVSVANSDFETDGSGFANFKSVDAGKLTNTLTAYRFSPGPSTTLPDGTPFVGFDGELFRGQIDNLGAYNGHLDLTVNFADGTTASHTFTGLNTNGRDFGVLGFDELVDPGVLVRSVIVSVTGDGGAWNEFKQIEFSVPGAIAVIPETQTWVMMALGFAIMGIGYGARTSRQRHARLHTFADHVAANG
jgi:hypothetical protein